MNTVENNLMEIADTSETPAGFPVELVPAECLTDGADLAAELVLAADLTPEEEELALEAIAISPEGMELNARAWAKHAEIAAAVAPALRAIQTAREALFRGYDERIAPPAIRMAGMTRN